MQINISVVNRIARVIGTSQIVCGNSDYVAVFTFDAEWNDYADKTARFQYFKDGKFEHVDIEFTGSSCAIPVLNGIDRVEIGVFAGEIRTTTPAVVPCCRCISDIPADEYAAPVDMYDQIMDMVQEAMNPPPESGDDEYFIVTAEGDYVTTSSGDYIIAKE